MTDKNRSIIFCSGRHGVSWKALGEAWRSTQHAFDRITALLAFNMLSICVRFPPRALALAFSNHLLEWNLGRWRREQFGLWGKNTSSLESGKVFKIILSPIFRWKKQLKAVREVAYWLLWLFKMHFAGLLETFAWKMQWKKMTASSWIYMFKGVSFPIQRFMCRDHDLRPFVGWFSPLERCS